MIPQHILPTPTPLNEWISSFNSFPGIDVYIHFLTKVFFQTWKNKHIQNMTIKKNSYRCVYMAILILFKASWAWNKSNYQHMSSRGVSHSSSTSRYLNFLVAILKTNKKFVCKWNIFPKVIDGEGVKCQILFFFFLLSWFGARTTNSQQYFHMICRYI